MLCAAFDIDGTLDNNEYKRSIVSAIRRCRQLGVNISIVSARMIPVLWGVDPDIREELEAAGIHEFMYNPWSPIYTAAQVARRKIAQLSDLQRRYENVVLFDDSVDNTSAALRAGIKAVRVGKDNPLSVKMIDRAFLYRE